MEVMQNCVFCTKHASLSLEDLLTPKFLKQIRVAGSISTELSICVECVPIVAKATECGEHVEELERSVRGLQLNILKMLRELSSLHTTYLEEMKKLTLKIQSSDTQHVKNENFMDIRKGVLNVVSDLDTFISDTNPSELPRIEGNTGDDNACQLAHQTQNEPQFSVKLEPQDTIENDEEDNDSAINYSTENSVENFDIDHNIYSIKQESDKTYHNTEVPNLSDEPDGNSCRICGKTFRKAAQLQQHLSTHTDKPFQCDVCPKGFWNSSDLSRHKKTYHTENQRFPCPHCDKNYLHKPTLEMHIKSFHSGQEWFDCHLCAHRYTTYKILKTHIRRFHYRQNTGKVRKSVRERLQVEPKMQ